MCGSGKEPGPPVPGGGRLDDVDEGRHGLFVDGIVEPGEINYIPAGVFAVTAVEPTIGGNFFINGSIHGIGKVNQPVELGWKREESRRFGVGTKPQD